MRTHNKESQTSMTPEMAIAILKEGNERFVGNLKFNRNLLQQEHGIMALYLSHRTEFSGQFLQILQTILSDPLLLF